MFSPLRTAPRLCGRPSEAEATPTTGMFSSRKATRTSRTATCGTTFTSAPAVRNLFLIATEMGLEQQVRTALNTAVLAVMVGPVCAAAAKEVGITACVVPEKYRLGPMIRALSDALLSDKRPLTLGSIPIVQQGTNVTVNGKLSVLSAREASLLAALLARRPQVISKRELLNLVWNGEGDEHVVEVTIARLRAKLGIAASGIVSIPRRGYRASL